MTDEELDALVQELMNRPYRRGGESNDEAAMRRQGEREQAAAAITTLRAQLAEAWAKLSQRVDMHECAMAERDDATLYGVEQRARADRAEAALAAAEVATHVPAKVQALVEDSRLLLDAYKAVLVLHRVMDKHGLTAGASAAENIADRIVAAHPEFPGLCAFRDAALAAMKEG